MKYHFLPIEHRIIILYKKFYMEKPYFDVMKDQIFLVIFCYFSWHWLTKPLTFFAASVFYFTITIYNVVTQYCITGHQNLLLKAAGNVFIFINFTHQEEATFMIYRKYFLIILPLVNFHPNFYLKEKSAKNVAIVTYACKCPLCFDCYYYCYRKDIKTNEKYQNEGKCILVLFPSIYLCRDQNLPQL